MAGEVSRRYCAVRYPKQRRFAAGVSGERARLLRQSADKWLNGSTLRYWFFDKPARWNAPDAQKDVVRQAFGEWKALGIGLEFTEVGKRADADIRIAFEQGDGSWSYIGTDVRTRRTDPRTMNFGWSLTDDPVQGINTALHEIGHALGFPHEHQNPFAGIVWNEPAVYAALGAPPNQWTRATTYRNIIEKLAPDAVQGSHWDPDSVMHYPFEAGMIEKPARYRAGLSPAGGLSARDRQWALAFYPGIGEASERRLQPFQSVTLSFAPGGQTDFRFDPGETREYEFRTFGACDTVMALDEIGAAGARRISEDDDTGVERNARIKARLRAGRSYVLRVRLHYAKASGQTAVMVW